MNNATAQDKADAMILKILETQPELLRATTTGAGAAAGKDVGDFISSLRVRLEAMYQQKS